jgi:NADPH:quinone reductase-like Zn-dependent oxidoreductase
VKAGVCAQINVSFQTHDLREPGENEVVVDIHAAALNFRDVLIAINMLPELSFEGSYYGRHMGMEAAGVISAVGRNVAGFQVGDRVATSEPSCFGNRLIAPANRVVKLHDNISMVVAASTQSVYNTAHHALVNLARIRKGKPRWFALAFVNHPSDHVGSSALQATRC